MRRGTGSHLGTEEGALAQGSAGVLTGICVVFEVKKTALLEQMGRNPRPSSVTASLQGPWWAETPRGRAAGGGLLPAPGAGPFVHGSATRGQQHTTVFSHSPPEPHSIILHRL